MDDEELYTFVIELTPSHWRAFTNWLHQQKVGSFKNNSEAVSAICIYRQLELSKNMSITKKEEG